MSHYNILAEFEKSSDRTETRGYFRGIWSNDTPEEGDEEIQNEFINVQEENLQRSSITFPNEVHEQNELDPMRMTLSNDIVGDFEDNFKSIIPKSLDAQSGLIWSGNVQKSSLTSKNEISNESLIKTHSDDFDFKNVENKDKKEMEKRTANNVTKKEEDKKAFIHSKNLSKQAFSETELHLHDFETDATDYFDSEDEYFETYRNNFEDSPMFTYHGMIHSPLSTSAVNGRYSEGVSRYNNMPVFVTSLQRFAKANGFTVHNVMADGNCLFRAINDQLSVNGIFGNSPESLRKNTINYLRENPYQEDGSHTESFLFTENWEQYLSRMEQSTEWCDHVIFKAAVDALGLRVVVFNVYGDDIRRTEVLSRKQSVDIITIYLGHFGEFHYLSLRPNNWESEWQNKALMFRHQLPIRQFESMKIQSDEKKGVENCLKITSKSDFDTEIQTDWKSSEKFGFIVCPVYGLKDLDMEENQESMHRLIEDPFYIDTRTGLPLQHLSYLMNHLIPPRMTLVNSHALPPVEKNGTMFQYLGSFATGTYAFLQDIPLGYTSRNHIKKHATVVALRPLTSAILIDTKDIHPGFLRLKVLSMSHLFPEKSLHRCENDVFLKRLDVPDNMSLPKMSERCYIGFCSGEFPLAADEWRNRQRKWPPHEVVTAVYNAGCTLIPKHHPKSCNPEIEWKFNFTNSEVLLFSKAVTGKQRRGFFLLHMLFDNNTCHFRRKLKMKHTKAVFFNCCEQIPVEKWETNLSGCILYATAFLLACLRERNLPHYFIPSFNLFENYKEEDLEIMCIQIEAIRLFPVQTLQFLTESYGYSYGANLSRLVLQDCKRFASSRDILSTYHDVFIPGTIKTVKFLTRQGYYKAAYFLLLNTYVSRLCFTLTDTSDFNCNFTEFFCRALHEIRQEASRTILAKKFENEHGVKILDSVMKAGGLFVEDIVPWGVNYEIAKLHIPMEKMSNFESIGDFFYEYSKTEVKRFNSDLATIGISEAIRCFERAIQEGPMIDVEIDDEALIKEIQSQRSEIMKKLKEKLMNCYIHTMKISQMHRTYLPLEIYMPAIEELCQEMPDISGVVSIMYQYLNNPSKQKEYQTRFDSILGTGEVYKGPSTLKTNRF
ncbi:uncharacterized protein LOC134270865 [Saccostrea cucullata]|uniref:uncharacterized protein LOC134270865 n=1 Tax=Saccostrea cuccullata TaxID=36930 RepID=UPI002ED5A6DE